MQSTNKKAQNIKIFLVGLHTTFTQEKVLSFFRSKFSCVTKCKLITKINKKGQFQNTGYGTLFVSSQETYENVLNEGNFILEGRRFFSKPFMEGNALHQFKAGIKNKRAFLHNIDPKLDNQALRTIMRSHARIEDAYIINRRGGNKDPSKPNFGFVMFKEVSDAKRLIESKEIHYEGGRFYISEYKNEDDRKKETVSFLKRAPSERVGPEAVKAPVKNKEKAIEEFEDIYTSRLQHHCDTIKEIASMPGVSSGLRKEFCEFMFFKRINSSRGFRFREFEHGRYNLRVNGGPRRSSYARSHHQYHY